jgi:hypothetical protein
MKLKKRLTLIVFNLIVPQHEHGGDHDHGTEDPALSVTSLASTIGSQFVADFHAHHHDGHGNEDSVLSSSLALIASKVLH